MMGWRWLELAEKPLEHLGQVRDIVETSKYICLKLIEFKTNKNNKFFQSEDSNIKSDGFKSKELNYSFGVVVISWTAIYI